MKKTILALLLLLLAVSVLAEQYQPSNAQPKYHTHWAPVPGKCNMGLLLKTSQGKQVCARHRGGPRAEE